MLRAGFGQTQITLTELTTTQNRKNRDKKTQAHLAKIAMLAFICILSQHDRTPRYHRVHDRHDGSPAPAAVNASFATGPAGAFRPNPPSNKHANDWNTKTAMEEVKKKSRCVGCGDLFTARPVHGKSDAITLTRIHLPDYSLRQHVQSSTKLRSRGRHCNDW